MNKKEPKPEKRKELRSVPVEMISSEVRERLLFLLHSNVVHHGRYKYLEKRYGISARRWQNVCNRVQQPGIDMLSLILMDRPEYATWLMFGQACNSDSGQIDPTKQNRLDETDEGQIDLTEPRWEEKYDRIQEALYLKTSSIKR